MNIVTGNNSRIYAAIDLDAIKGNLERLHEHLLSIGRDVFMTDVIKADGYGHGSIPIARMTDNLEYIRFHAVATFEEAKELHQAGIRKPCLILGYTFPYCYEELIDLECRPAVFRHDTLHELSETASRMGKTVSIHIAVDTGMRRIGISPDENGIAFIKEAAALPGIRIEGLFTHFACADDKDTASAYRQYDIFKMFEEKAEEAAGGRIPVKHCSNSAAIIRFPEMAEDMVRCGIILYGLWPSDYIDRNIVRLEPAMSLHSHIVFIKTVPAGEKVSYGGLYTTSGTTRIAPVPSGYADGYSRSLTGKAFCLVRGQRVPVIGRICMDQMMLDVTSLPDAAVGDHVTLVGRDGDNEITMEELGDMSGRFNYEFACAVSKRVPRVYFAGDEYLGTELQ